MWTDESTLREQFADIEALAAQCRFFDCKHGSDAGCAIRASAEAGLLDPARYAGFLKLDLEIEKLKGSRKKRQMTIERRFKREGRKNLHNPEDRRDLERETKPW